MDTNSEKRNRKGAKPIVTSAQTNPQNKADTIYPRLKYCMRNQLLTELLVGE